MIEHVNSCGIWNLITCWSNFVAKKPLRVPYQDLIMMLFLFIFSTVLVFSCFTHFSFSPLTFLADQTKCRLNWINLKKRNHQAILFITSLLSQRTSQWLLNVKLLLNAIVVKFLLLERWKQGTAISWRLRSIVNLRIMAFYFIFKVTPICATRSVLSKHWFIVQRNCPLRIKHSSMNVGI